MMDIMQAITRARQPGGGGMTLSAGAAEVFENAVTESIAICAMDSTHAIVCYQDAGNSYYGTACCLSLSGTTITAGTPVVFCSAYTLFVSVCSMDSTHAIVAYRGGNGIAVCLSLSGTTITAGTPVTFNNADTYYVSLCRMDSSKAIVAYRNNGGSPAYYGNAVCLSLSGTTLTAGTPLVFNAATTLFTAVASLSDTKAIVAYRNDGDSYRGTAKCLSLSGTTITAGSATVFNSANTEEISIAGMDSGKAIVAYKDDGNSARGTACCLSLSGTTITAGGETIFNDANTGATSVSAFDAEFAVVAWRNNYGSPYYGKAAVLRLSGTTITGGDPVTINDAGTNYVSVAVLDSARAIVAFKDEGNSNYGTACCLTRS